MTMTIRYVPPMAGAAAMTFALFFIMQMLVSQKLINTVPPTASYPVNSPWPELTPPPPDDPEPIIKTEVIPPPKGTSNLADPRREDRPGPIEFQKFDTVPGGGNGDGGLTTLAAMSQEMVPLVIVQPVYPVGPLGKGTEGYVVLEFEVDEMGNVQNPHVLYAEPPGTFDKAAIKAIGKSRFRPMMIEDRPRAVAGIRYKYVFNIN